MKKSDKILLTYERSLVKGIVWEAFGFLITLFAIYLVYGDLNFSIVFALILTLIKMVLFFIHEMIWKKVRWGIETD
jgi:adenylylsulfate kinase